MDLTLGESYEIEAVTNLDQFFSRIYRYAVHLDGNTETIPVYNSKHGKQLGIWILVRVGIEWLCILRTGAAQLELRHAGAVRHINVSLYHGTLQVLH